ncbi:MAG TPA: EF-hand domain-containing protein [Sphingomicrobium sp.]
MNGYLLIGAAAAAIAGAGAAIAQAPPAEPAHRGHMMQTVTRADIEVRIAKHFARLDTNHDGFVTRAEADAAMAGRKVRFEQRGEKRAAAGFDRLDVNKDGQISRQEWDAGRQKRVAIREARPGQPMGGNVFIHRMGGMHHAGMGFGARMFDMADLNKDGKVSLAEAQQLALQHFDRADLNHDGKLTPEERRQARQSFRDQHKPS